MIKEQFIKIDNDNVRHIITKEVDEETELHLPDLENRLQQAKDEVKKLEELLAKAKKAKKAVK